MLDQQILREQFQNLLARQQDTLGAYESVTARQTDPTHREQLSVLCRDKRRAIQLTERLLEIVE